MSSNHKKLTINLGTDNVVFYDDTQNPSHLPSDESVFTTFDNVNLQEDNLIILEKEQLTQKPPNDNFLFKNRKKYFSDFDWGLIEKDEKKLFYINTIFHFLDELVEKTNELKDLQNINKIKDEYIPYLSYLLGYQIVDFNVENLNIRELTKNLVNIYKIKGTNFAFEIFFKSLGFKIEVKELWWDNANEYIANDETLRQLYLKPYEELSEETKNKIKSVVKQDDTTILEYYKNKDLFYKYNKSNYISIKLSRKGKENQGFTANQLKNSLSYLSFLTPAHIEVLNINLVTDFLERFFTDTFTRKYIIVRVKQIPNEIIILNDDKTKIVGKINQRDYNHNYIFTYDSYSNLPNRIQPNRGNILGNGGNSISYNYYEHFGYNDGFSHTDFYSDFRMIYDYDYNEDFLFELKRNSFFPSVYDGFYSHKIIFSDIDIETENLNALDELIDKIVLFNKIQVWEGIYNYTYNIFDYNFREEDWLTYSMDENIFDGNTIVLYYNGSPSFNTAEIYPPEEFNSWRRPGLITILPYVDYLKNIKIQKLNPNTLENFSHIIENIYNLQDFLDINSEIGLFELNPLDYNDNFFVRIINFDSMFSGKRRGTEYTDIDEFRETTRRDDYYYDRLYKGSTRVSEIDGISIAYVSSTEIFRIFKDILTCRFGEKENIPFTDLNQQSYFKLNIGKYKDNIQTNDYGFMRIKQSFITDTDSILANDNGFFMIYKVEGNERTPLI